MEPSNGERRPVGAGDQDIGAAGSSGDQETMDTGPAGSREVETKVSNSSPSPLIHIHYYDNAHAQGIYQLIEAYMLSLQSSAMSQDLRQQVEAVSRDATDEGSVEETTTEPTVTVTTTTEEEEEEEEEKGHVEYFEEYCIDKFAMTYKTEVLFDRVYTEPFWVDPFVEKEERRLRRMAIRCFNCGEDHHLNQCTEPIDPQKVSNESKLYRESLGTLGSDKRYHLNPTDRFAKFAPGKLSAKLRQALGIGPSDYPPYMDRMCVLGYPPGYRISAEEETLLFYNDPDKGEPVQHEIKVIIYPGFNDQQPPPLEEIPSPQPQEGDKTTCKEKGSVERDREKEDDLGSCSDYELEEVDGDDGEMVVGFCVGKEASSSPTVTPKNFSLDFPPGLVDINAKSKPSERWNAIKELLKSKT